MNNLIFPEAAAPVGDIAAMIFQAMQQHENYRKGVLAACRTFYKLDLHTLQHVRKLFAEPTMRHQYPKGRDFQDGESYAFARIDEILANAIALAGGPEVTPEYAETEQNCPGCMGPCGRCDEPDLPEQEPKIPYNLMPPSAPDWRTSLRKRPKTNEQ